MFLLTMIKTGQVTQGWFINIAHFVGFCVRAPSQFIQDEPNWWGKLISHVCLQNKDQIIKKCIGS